MWYAYFMKALVYKGNGIIQKEQRPFPVIKDEKDAIVKVTISSICTSDLHIMHGAVTCLLYTSDAADE